MIGQKIEGKVTFLGVDDEDIVSITLQFDEGFLVAASDVLGSDNAESHGIDGVLLVDGMMVLLDHGEVTYDPAGFVWLGYVEGLSPTVAKAFVESLAVDSTVEAIVVQFEAAEPPPDGEPVDGACDDCDCECGGCVDDQGEETAPEDVKTERGAATKPVIFNVQVQPISEGPCAYYIEVGQMPPHEIMRALNYARRALRREGIDELFVPVRDGVADLRIEDGNVALERLAALEHTQWQHWTKYMLDNLTPDNIARWKRQCETAYADLSEQEKASDREWARKAMAALVGGGEK